MKPLISPVSFAARMEDRWVNTLGNTSSDTLKAVWAQMAQVYGQAILNSDQADQTLWRVLQPPTGTGKTQGLCVYASMVADQNTKVATSDRMGILVVTRLIKQCDEVVDTINELSKRQVAVAKHSDTSVTFSDMRSADILVITHQAYSNAIEGVTKDMSSQWDNYITWDHGKRCLTVIDEALSSVVDHNKVTSDELSSAIGLIPDHVKMKFPHQLEALETVRSVLLKTQEITEYLSDNEAAASTIVWRSAADGKIKMPAIYAMGELREALKSVEFEKSLFRKEDVSQRNDIFTCIDKTLRDTQAVLEKWSYYARKGNEHSFNVASLLIPHELPGPVVMDATATQNFLWELFEDKAIIYPVPSGARSYSNVTLHVARASGVGKHKMIKTAEARVPRLLENLQGHLGKDRKVFLCCHKAIEYVVKKYAPEFDHDGDSWAKSSVAHWGAVDGLNLWDTYDTAVIFGLSYRDHIWATNTFMAFRGLQDNEWMRTPSYKKYVDVRKVMQDRQLTVSIIQAINRVRCRKVIDKDGNCLPTDVFIILPKDSTGDEILESIQTEMPGIVVSSWDFVLDPDRPSVPQVQKGSLQESLVSYMDGRLPGVISVSDLRAKIGIGHSNWKNKIIPAINDQDHPLSVALSDLGVTYRVEGRGRGARSYLHKKSL